MPAFIDICSKDWRKNQRKKWNWTSVFPNVVDVNTESRCQQCSRGRLKWNFENVRVILKFWKNNFENCFFLKKKIEKNNSYSLFVNVLLTFLLPNLMPRRTSLRPRLTRRQPPNQLLTNRPKPRPNANVNTPKRTTKHKFALV